MKKLLLQLTLTLCSALITFITLIIVSLPDKESFRLVAIACFAFTLWLFEKTWKTFKAYRLSRRVDPAVHPAAWDEEWEGIPERMFKEDFVKEFHPPNIWGQEILSEGEEATQPIWKERPMSSDELENSQSFPYGGQEHYKRK